GSHSPPLPSVPSPLLGVGDDVIGLAVRKFVLDRTGIPAEVDRFRTGILARATVLRAMVDALIADVLAFTLTPMQPGALTPRLPVLPHLPLPAPPAMAVEPAPDRPVQRGITVFGGAADRNESAYDGHVITDDEEGCALPFHFDGPRPLVSITGPKGAATV